jgi:hypothetical protein
MIWFCHCEKVLQSKNYPGRLDMARRDMADKPENELPKVPPFHILDGSGRRVEPSMGPPSPPEPPAPKNGYPSERGMLNLVMTLISSVSLGIAMLSGAWFAYGILEGNREGVFSKIVVVGLAYIVGWIVSVFGIRVLGNFVLPYVIKIFAWTVLGGIVILQIVIISKLFRQEYQIENYVRYLLLFGAGMIALIGLHLILEEHRLGLFAIPILLTSLAHLYFIVFHYIFLPVKYEYIWGDVIFLLITIIVSLLMLAHFGILNGFRRFMDRTFNPKDNPFAPPD